jgi:hypothetical protein
MDSRYEHHYGSPLLDELHNIFPAILYDPAQFRTVADVLAYIQSQTQRRFNLYSSGMNQYHQRVDQRNQVNTTTPITATFFMEEETENDTRWREVERLMSGILGHNATVTMPRVSNNAVNALDARILLSLLSGLSGSNAVAAPALTPVIVRPTEQQIRDGTRDDLVGVTSDICAICQDGFDQGVERRTLVLCSHGFHRGCIDQWFLQNVRCPVCRRDIREATRVAD